jgi:hypothetical protein
MMRVCAGFIQSPHTLATEAPNILLVDETQRKADSRQRDDLNTLGLAADDLWQRIKRLLNRFDPPRLSQPWLSAAGARLEDRDPFAELQVGIEFSSFFRIENSFAVFIEQLFQAFLCWRRILKAMICSVAGPLVRNSVISR